MNEGAKIDVQIINYQKLKVPERDKDEPIENYSLERNGRGKWIFQHKHDSDNDLEELEIRLKVKKHYMIRKYFFIYPLDPEEAMKNSQAGLEPILITEEVRNNKLLYLIETKERERVDKLKVVQREIDKGFKENVNKEYNLLKKCMPHKLLKGQDFFDQQYESMKESMIEISDTDDLSKELSKDSKNFKFKEKFY